MTDELWKNIQNLVACCVYETKVFDLGFLYEFAQGVFVSCVPEILYYDDKECDFSPRLSVDIKEGRQCGSKIDHD